jgi:hypothetical protein
LALYVILFLLAGSLFGAWLWLLIKLPGGMAYAFDEVKNKIASRQIATAKVFAYEIGKFMTEYFSFFRFDILAVQIRIIDNPPLFYPELFTGFSEHDETYTKISQAGEAIVFVERIELDKQSVYSYLIPLWFGKQWLGYITVYSDTRLNKISRNFLQDFEALYIDDQLMHVLYYESQHEKQEVKSPLPGGQNQKT